MVRNIFNRINRQRFRRQFKGGLREAIYSRNNQDYGSLTKNNLSVYGINNFNSRQDNRKYSAAYRMFGNRFNGYFSPPKNKINYLQRKNIYESLNRKGIFNSMNKNRNYFPFRNDLSWNENPQMNNSRNLNFMRGPIQMRQNNSEFNNNRTNFQNHPKFNSRRRRRNRRNGKSRPFNENDLNAQLDAYMGTENVQSKLDSQLDAYFGRVAAPTNENGLNTVAPLNSMT